MSKKELLEKWNELFIRFNTAPKIYQKIDFLKLLKFLKELIDSSGGGGLQPEDLKTINNESIVGEGDIKIPNCGLSVDYTFQLEGKYIYIDGEYIEDQETIVPRNAQFDEQTNTIILL